MHNLPVNISQEHIIYENTHCLAYNDERRNAGD